MFSGHQMQNLVSQSNQSDIDGLEEDDDLRGSQENKFQEMLKNKFEDDEDEESEASVQPIDPNDFLINDGYKIHMKGIKVHEREIKKVHKN